MRRSNYWGTFLGLCLKAAVVIAMMLALSLLVLKQRQPELNTAASQAFIIAFSLSGISTAVLGNWAQRQRRGVAGALRLLLLMLSILAIGMTCASMVGWIALYELIVLPVLLVSVALLLWQLVFANGDHPSTMTR